jgi:16S rRNA (guanine527-N7)-methyltransferase
MSAEVDGAFIVAKLEAAGIDVERSAGEALARFLSLLERWNRVYNLTGARTASALIDPHLIESLAIAPLVNGMRIADVGSGAGWPGLPLAILAPQRSFTLIESRAKRARFLRHVAGEIKLRNVTVVQRRVEDLRCEVAFDTVLARAVAPPADLIRLVRHLTAPGSRIVIVTGPTAAEAGAQDAEEFVRRPVGRAVLRHVRGGVLVLERCSRAEER